MRRLRGVAGLILAVLPVMASVAAAQSVRPVIVEYRESARSRFELVNDSLFPMNVTLDVRTFSISETGEAAFGPLDPSVHLRLSGMSFHIPPRQSRWVFYEATTDHAPAWFTIYATFARAVKGKGMDIQVELPHTVYLLQKEPLRQEDVAVSVQSFDPVGRHGVVLLENRGDRLGRVLDARVVQKGDDILLGGFPLLPESRRLVAFDWTGTAPPTAATFEFKGFRAGRDFVTNMAIHDATDLDHPKAP